MPDCDKLAAAREALEASTDGTNYATLHPDHVAAILYALDHHAAALAAARAEGAQDAFERAASICDGNDGNLADMIREYAAKGRGR